MWGALKKLFGGKSTDESAAPDENDVNARWVAADASGWGVELVDMREFATSMISTSQDSSRRARRSMP